MDLNADVGESYGRWSLGDDAALLEVVSSANVACAAHAGDATTMRRSCELAVARGVRVGAQVGYRDLPGFGRRFIDVDPDELADDIVAQIGALQAAARVAGTSVRFVKPHGALYHAVATHQEQAAAVVGAVRSLDDTLPLVGLPGSRVLQLALQAGLPVLREGFADRAYTTGGALVDRREPGAVLTSEDAVVAQAVSIARDAHVTATGGARLAVQVDTLCLHGDTPGAVRLARAVRNGLAAAGIDVRCPP